MDLFNKNKIEMLSGVTVINDNALAVQILKSDAFSVINIVDYLRKLESGSGLNFKKLIEFTSNSPFFIEGDKHSNIKKLFSNALGKTNINIWQPSFEDKIEVLTRDFKHHAQTDLMNYCFDISKTLLRPIIFGTETEVPDDFEKRLYNFQKIAEPLLPIRQLVKLEGEIEYLLSCIKNCLDHSTECIPHSLRYYLNDEATADLSDDDKIMLLMIVYGAKTPLIQTLANIFLDILVNHKTDFFNSGVFNEQYFHTQIDEILDKAASLLHIHRVAVKDFSCHDINIKEGDVVLIRIGSSAENQCPHHKNLSFGLRTHYCSGAMMSKTIICGVVPAFFKVYPHVMAQTWEYDSSIHTARALITLKVILE